MPRSSRVDINTTDVWVVEDNAASRDAITAIVNEAEGFRCSKAFTLCEEAIRTLKREDDPPMAVLMDIELPEMDGIQGLMEIKKLSPATEVIMLTVHRDDDRIVKAFFGGASGYIVKPSNSTEIIKSIKDVLNGGSYLTSEIARRAIEMFRDKLAPKELYDLTRREKEVLELTAQGFTKKQIAQKLFIGYYAVDTHMKNIHIKMGVHNKGEAVSKWLLMNPLRRR